MTELDVLRRLAENLENWWQTPYQENNVRLGLEKVRATLDEWHEIKVKGWRSGVANPVPSQPSSGARYSDDGT